MPRFFTLILVTLTLLGGAQLAKASCPTNRVVECGIIWDFDAPGLDDVCGGTNATVTVVDTTTNALCGNTFSATRSWQIVDGCSNTIVCTQVVTVVDATAPVLVCASNLMVECGTVWNFEAPGVSDACDGTNVTVMILDTVTNALCGATFNATRTWLATDACGNTNICAQVVTVVDTTPPALTCASNQVIECGTPWNFEAPTASDVCDGTNVLVVILTTTTNQLIGETFAATRTWQATDACSNVANCSQTITIMDTTPPQIVCPSNIVVECDGPPGKQVFYTPTASDGCDSNVTVVCSPPAGSTFALGTNLVTCTATDDSGNTNQCSFEVVVVDTTPPLIPCPPNMIVSEAPRDSGGAAVTFPTPLATDICDNALQLVSSVPSGYVFPLGTNTLTWTAIDGSGNSNSCTFTIRVIPYRLFVVTNTDDAGPGSLRQALLDGNDAPDENLILFSLPGPGPHVIHLLSALPPITSPTILDGWSASSSNAPPVVELDGGAGTNAFDGLILLANNSTIRGLAMYGFADAFRLDATTNSVIQGNYIGTDSTGTNAPGNLGDGVLLTNQAAHNLIGANLIAYNGANGVRLDASSGAQNGILHNSIHSNAQLGIDLGGDGPTPNDLNDPDIGPNQRQNFPLLADVQSYDGFTVVYGTLNSAPIGNYHVEFFLNDTTNNSGYGEGRMFLGARTIFVHGDGNGDFAESFSVPATFVQFVTATATDADGNTSEFSPPVRVRTPPVLEAQPTNTVVSAGSNVSLCVTASGTPPIYYQWRHNGANIPGATNSCYTIPSAQVGDAGAYSVVLKNDVGAIATTPTGLRLPLWTLAAGDNFADRVPLTGTSGVVAGSNQGATRELGEPNHAGKPGGKSVWYTWTAPITGIATVGTAGSTFDTLLGVYRGTNVAVLTTEASDEDGGGYFTSGVRFNAIKNRVYHFAIDGFFGQEGDFAFGWQMIDTPHLLPVITVQPQSQTVGTNSSVTFTVEAIRVCGNGHNACPQPSHYPHEQLPGLSVLWFFEGQPIPGETNYSLTIPSVQPEHVGQYTAQVSAQFFADGINRTVESDVADLQIGTSGSGAAVDKFENALLTAPIVLGPPEGGLAARGEFAVSAAAGVVVSGYTGTQIFNTTNSTGQGEVFCGVIGGASEWLSFLPTQSGLFSLNTDGSTFDTLLAIVLSNSPPQLLGCDNNSGQGGTNSALTVAVEGGKTYLVGVDGVNGAWGRVVLNYNLNTNVNLSAPTVTTLGVTNNVYQLRVTGVGTNKFTIQVSTNLSSWATLTTNNTLTSVYDYVDWRSTNFAKRFYRLKLVP